MGAHELRRGLIVAAVLAAALACAAEDGPPPAPVQTAAAGENAETPQPAEPPPPVPPAAAAQAAKFGVSVVPIPELILDPNEGNTYGLLATWLLTDANGEVRYMVAPDIRYNSTKGVFPNFRLFGYPSKDTRYTVLIGKSTTRDENYEFEYANRGLWDERAYFLAHFLYARDSTERFFGFGNDTSQHEESNYTSKELLLDATPGVWILPTVNVSYRMRVRWHGVEPGQVTSVPFLLNEHPEVQNKGAATAAYFQHRLALTYDSRDSIDMPTQGTFANAYVDGADKHVGSATSFTAFGFEWRNFHPFRASHNPILAMRAFVDYLQGGTDTPFWLQNSLGGRRALRGFGGDRFIDFNRALMSAELRTRVYQRHLFGVTAEVELAPFVEAGQVFRHIYDPPLDALHWVGGIGFRGLVRPQIVAFVDVGYGSDGNSIFTGVDYPF
jgi:surface antigen Omp85-like protein